MTIAVHIRDARWKQALPSCAGIVHKACKAAINSSPRRREGIRLTVVLANDAFVRKLNKDFRGKDKPTNVLSFPFSPDPRFPTPDPYLGDIVLARQTIAREAKEQGKTLKAHVAHLAAHGTLHLLGYSHDRAKKAQIMEALEVKILKTLGVSNPYL